MRYNLTIRKNILWFSVAWLLLSLNSCKTPIVKDLKFLKSDWLNANYTYILFFNDSTVLTSPNENGNFIFGFKVKQDTLLISKNISSNNEWSKYQILTLNKDALILKNLSKNDERLKADTITLINTSAIKKNIYSFKRINFTFERGYKKVITIMGDTLLYSSNGGKFIGEYYSKLSNKQINLINQKLNLIETTFPSQIDLGGPGSPYITLDLEIIGEKPIKLKGSPPPPEENLRLAGLIVFLNNLDQIVDLKEKK
jgi:hypothetical protein